MNFAGKSATHSLHNAWEYKEIDKHKLKALPDLMKQFGHKKLSILTIDFEGCEWQVLEEIMCNHEIEIDQIIVVTLLKLRKSCPLGIC